MPPSSPPLLSLVLVVLGYVFSVAANLAFIHSAVDSHRLETAGFLLSGIAFLSILLAMVIDVRT